MTLEHRQSALLLHALDLRDRDWIMAHLGGDDRQAIHEYLVELQQLGIPADRSLVESVLGVQQDMPADVIRSATAADMHSLLADEPLWLVRHVLALEDWRWRNAFLELQIPLRRERLKSGQISSLSPKASESLYRQLSRRLARNRSATRATPRRNAAGVLSLLRRKLRL